jgi:hypothetical protein
MSRAAGKHGPRWVSLDELLGGTGDGQTEGERAEEGIGDGYVERIIPGGQNHLGNPPVKTQAVPVPEREWPYRRALLAHGVPPDGQHADRDPRLTGGQRGQAKTTKPVPRQTPVPVYIVEGLDGAGVVRAASPRSITCPASTAAEPARVCGRAPGRIEIQLLNEDTATDMRFATTLAQLAAGVGALLPWPSNSYVTIKTQGELYAIGATGSGTPRLSIIEVFEEKLGE